MLIISRYLPLIALILVSLNLRPALTSIAPLIEVMVADTGLTRASVGMITTLPIHETTTPLEEASLTLMMLTFGFCIGSLALSIVGVARGYSGSYTLPFAGLVVASATMVLLSALLGFFMQLLSIKYINSFALIDYSRIQETILALLVNVLPEEIKRKLCQIY